MSLSFIKIVKQKNTSQIKKIIAETPINKLSIMIEKLSDKEFFSFFKLIENKEQSKLFVLFDYKIQEKIIKNFSNKKLKKIIDNIFADDLMHILKKISNKNLNKKILKATDIKKRLEIHKLSKYSDDQIGYYMTVEILTIKQNMTAKEASKLIRQKKDKVKMTHYFFVINQKNKLLGYVALEELFLAKGNVKIKNLMNPIVSLKPNTNKEKASLIFVDNEMPVLPVVNNFNEIVGMVTSIDIIDVFQESATEDIKKMAGITTKQPVEIKYSKKSIFRIFKSRIFWLTWLMLSATLSEFVSQHFIDIITKQRSVIYSAHLSSAVVSIAPVIAGSAGNSGSQASTTVIRALATGDIKGNDYFKVLWKEWRVALLVGFALGLFNFLRLIIYYTALDMIDIDTVFVSLSASIALFLVVNIGKILGGVLPIFYKKIKLDPAIMSAPVLTTLLDALSLTTFFSISIAIMLIVL